jgi:PadR family transcriptional regulator, regulatory protein PadR
MSSFADIGPLDQQVMLAILRLQPTAYGISIQDEIEQRGRRAYSIGAIYAALDRLEQNGLIVGKAGESTAQRGGRAKRYFTLTAPGQATLQASLQAIDSMRRGIRFKGVPA